MHDNPAARLSDLMQRGRSIPGKKKVYAAWAELLDVGTDDMGALMAEIALVVDLPRQIRLAIQALPGDASVYLEHLPNIEQQLYFIPLQHEWSSVVSNTSEQGLYCLKVCAERLHIDRPEPVLEEDQLSEIQQAVRDLLGYMDEADLPPSLRAFALKHLHAIEVALRHVQIRGLEPLSDELLRMVGDFVVDLDVRGSVQADDDSTAPIAAFFQRALGWIVAIQTATTGVEKTATAIESVKQTIKALTTGS